MYVCGREIWCMATQGMIEEGRGGREVGKRR